MATFCKSEPWISRIAHLSLFEQILHEDLLSLLHCIDAKVYCYEAQEIIVHQQQNIQTFGMILQGRAQTFLQEENGKNITLSLVEEGGEIAVIIAACPGTRSPVSVQAKERSTVLMIPFAKMLQQCTLHCAKHQQLLVNYIGLLSCKGLALHDRIACLLKPTVRQKILSYFHRVAKEQKSNLFCIPMNRYELSEYLNIERSALSRELSRMKKEGLIDYYKNSFHLHSE